MRTAPLSLRSVAIPIRWLSLEDGFTSSFAFLVFGMCLWSFGVRRLIYRPSYSLVRWLLLSFVDKFTRTRIPIERSMRYPMAMPPAQTDDVETPV